jgi:hypothetical protein
MCQACASDFEALCERRAEVRQAVAEGLAEEIYLDGQIDKVLAGELHQSAT